jgi:hypothetical protein
MDAGLGKLPTVPGSTPYLTAGGLGLRFENFDHRSDLIQSVLTCHSLPVTHRAPAHQVRPSSVRDSLFLASFLNQGGIGRFPTHERLGLFLITRVTCRAGLTLFSDWYSAEAAIVIRGFLATRETRRLRLLELENVAWLCVRCATEWF